MRVPMAFPSLKQGFNVGVQTAICTLAGSDGAMEASTIMQVHSVGTKVIA